MDKSTDHVSIHMPQYETMPIHFQTPTPNVSEDVADIQNYIRERAEKKLQQCSSFTVSLPTSLTGITSPENRIEFKSLFQTPTLNELAIVSTNPDGSSIKLNDTQLRAVEKTGEFEVDSIHFPGQKHRWKLNRLLQSGIQCANEKLFKETSWALYMLIIFARDRLIGDSFSFTATLRSWRQGFTSFIDAIIGLPAMESQGIDSQVENERTKFLVIELSPHASEKEMHEAFCAQVPLLLEMMEEYERYKRRENQKQPPRMLPYPHHFVTPSNIDIDLRLYNQDLQTKISVIVSELLLHSTPKNWFHVTKRRLINEYKHNQNEHGLSKIDIAKRIQEKLNQEYSERAFETIENSTELEALSPGLGRLLVAQARSVLVMKSVVQKLSDDLDKYLKKTEENLVRQHPIKSKISRWLEGKLVEARMSYIREHEWDAHQLSIDQCKALGNQQAAYFIQRDWTFRKDYESILRLNLKPVKAPKRTLTTRRYIWFPKNWIVERTYPLPIERVATEFAESEFNPTEAEGRSKLVEEAEPEPVYSLRRHIEYSTTTRYPFWRWKLFALRTFCWLSNAIYCLCLVVPFVSPVSFRALLSPKAFTPNYYLDNRDRKLHKQASSTTQTFFSRLSALWRNIRRSRQKFEQAPDRGLLGKNIQRIFNQIWNYIGKGLIGTVAVCTIFPITCLIVSTLSFILGILSPIWLPIVTLIFHILQILFYDASSAGEYGRKLFCLINTILMDFGIGGIVQPILVLLALIASPLISLLIVIYALLHRGTCGLYDKITYHLIIKRFARVPAHDSFLARRVAGPGLAAEYFYQVSSPEVLAALESLVEQKELTIYRGYVEKLLMKPIDDYRDFFGSAFRPFSAVVQIDTNPSVFNRMNEVVNEHIKNLQKAVDRRQELLHVQRGSKHDRIRLTETDLMAVLVEGTRLVENWYPKRVYPYMTQDDIEKFWNAHDLDVDDWFGLTSQLLQELFCRDFLTPLEQTDVYYSLKVDHLTLSKYAHMINSANLRDDLDAVTSVYLPETSFTIHQPSFDERILDPNQQRIDATNRFYGHYRNKKRGRLYRLLNRKSNYIKNSQNVDFVDYTSVNCRFSTPTKLPEIICLNIIVFNRENNSISATSIKNVSLQKILSLIAYNKKFYPEPLFLSYSLATSSVRMPNATTSENLSDDTDNERLQRNTAVLDEDNL